MTEVAFCPNLPPTDLRNSGFLKNINLIRSFVFSPLVERRLHSREEAQGLAGAEVQTGADCRRTAGIFVG